MGSANIMFKKFSTYPKSFLGYTTGRPALVLKAIAASTGIFAISLIAESSLYIESLMSRVSCKKLERPAITLHIMLMGCALN